MTEQKKAKASTASRSSVRGGCRPWGLEPSVCLPFRLFLCLFHETNLAFKEEEEIVSLFIILPIERVVFDDLPRGGRKEGVSVSIRRSSLKRGVILLLPTPSVRHDTLRVHVTIFRLFSDY